MHELVEEVLVMGPSLLHVYVILDAFHLFANLHIIEDRQSYQQEEIDGEGYFQNGYLTMVDIGVDR